MGRRKDLPGVFEKIHFKNGVPHIGIFFTGAIILILCLVGTFEFILASAAFSILLFYSIANIAAFRQPKKDRRFGRIVPVVGLVGCLTMAISLNFEVIIYGVMLLAIGFILRFILHRKL